jgi:hypothetical protein
MSFVQGNSMTNDPPSLLVEVAAYLETQEQDIIFRWVQLASRLPAHFRRPDESLKALIDHIPLTLRHLRRLLLEPINLDEQSTLHLDITELHSVTRYNQGISARTVAKEYQLLRHEIWATLREWPRAQHFTAMDVFLLEEHLNFILDDIVSIAVDTFVELVAEGGNGDVEAADHPGGG